MTLFFVSVAILVVGYFTYGALIDRLFKPDCSRRTPAYGQTDGVDYVPLPWPKIFLIQLLNIAGLGPIFGALAGALWGPIAFVWIVLGCLFGGAVHDYLSGMMSLRNRGASISELTGFYLGPTMKTIMRVFSMVLMVLVGTVFMTGPAKLLAVLTPETLDFRFWMVAIMVYYFLATILPIDKLIGQVYPLFGVVLVVMAVGIGGALAFGDFTLPAFTWANVHPKGLPAWPLVCISIACGAISGFHSTQSPMMARCLKNERYGRRVFFGAMITEGIIALVWAAAGMAFYHGTSGLGDAMKAAGPGGVVNTVSITLLGKIGGLLAILGVIACPITSGDTAFRSARLIMADWFKLDQRPILKRLGIALPLFLVGGLLSQMNFDIIWRYFAWANQTLAVITLWACAVYLVRRGKPHWFASIPGTFMTAVSTTYLLQAPEGFHLPTTISYPVGGAIAGGVLLAFLAVVFRRNIGQPAEMPAAGDDAADASPAAEAEPAGVE